MDTLDEMDESLDEISVISQTLTKKGNGIIINQFLDKNHFFFISNFFGIIKLIVRGEELKI